MTPTHVVFWLKFFVAITFGIYALLGILVWITGGEVSWVLKEHLIGLASMSAIAAPLALVGWMFSR